MTQFRSKANEIEAKLAKHVKKLFFVLLYSHVFMPSVHAMGCSCHVFMSRFSYHELMPFVHAMSSCHAVHAMLLTQFVDAMQFTPCVHTGAPFF